VGVLHDQEAMASGLGSGVFAHHGLSGGHFEALLRRAPDPYVLIPSQLSDTLMMSRAGTPPGRSRCSRMSSGICSRS
jgi:hypothetical protein